MFLDKTKKGDKRQAPLTSVALQAVTRYQRQVARGQRGMKGFKFERGLLFPWWNGNPSEDVLRKTTSLLSQQFARVFDAAGCGDLRFHDLRHEADNTPCKRSRYRSVSICAIAASARLYLLR